ncbi:19903_t:CDS:2 [Gigaspora margarita]|uniref:19903_t:CDS:1 n=1 Tax=Gigaspora margarita TaxID=4874 RepID=A0ABN7UQ54_GIGMA|nr:19903_t:CDS:2 [Gigaspora margarita]
MNPFSTMMLASSKISQQTESKKHAGGKRKHYLTEYIIITNEYVNPQKPNDKYCYCLACHESNSEKVKIVNRKKLVKNHLKNCTYFIRKVGGKEQADNILNKEELETSKTLQLDDEEVSSKIESKKIDQFLARTPTFLEQAQFEDQILNITITDGWSFHWVEDKCVIAHYRWLNSHLVLPNRKQLAGRILKSATDTNRSYIQNKAHNDSHGIMIAFDRWKNVTNQEILDDEVEETNEENEQTISVVNWNEIVQQWTAMISEEEEIDLTIGEDNVDRIVNDTEHPAINNVAKWKLETLFKDDVPVPAFIYDL